MRADDVDLAERGFFYEPNKSSQESVFPNGVLFVRRESEFSEEKRFEHSSRLACPVLRRPELDRLSFRTQSAATETADGSSTRDSPAPALSSLDEDERSGGEVSHQARCDANKQNVPCVPYPGGTECGTLLSTTLHGMLGGRLPTNGLSTWRLSRIPSLPTFLCAFWAE